MKINPWTFGYLIPIILVLLSDQLWDQSTINFDFFGLAPMQVSLSVILSPLALYFLFIFLFFFFAGIRRRNPKPRMLLSHMGLSVIFAAVILYKLSTQMLGLVGIEERYYANAPVSEFTFPLLIFMWFVLIQLFLIPMVYQVIKGTQE